jgi:flagellum-specific peptidoglycan hydrolase FlgJ
MKEPMTRDEFLKAASAAALASSATSGLLPGVTVAQSALETNFGRSALSRDAHNYFGIKAVRGRNFLEMPTREVVGGQEQRTTARFARFESMEDCFAFRDHLILKAPLYAEARVCARDAVRFVEALAKHWATDAGYSQKILSIYRTNRLDAFDAEIERAPQAAGPLENSTS